MRIKLLEPIEFLAVYTKRLHQTNKPQHSPAGDRSGGIRLQYGSMVQTCILFDYLWSLIKLSKDEFLAMVWNKILAMKKKKMLKNWCVFMCTLTLRHFFPKWIAPRFIWHHLLSLNASYA